MYIVHNSRFFEGLIGVRGENECDRHRLILLDSEKGLTIALPEFAYPLEAYYSDKFAHGKFLH